VPARVSPVERVRAEIDQLFADPTRALGDVVEDVARLGARLLLQTALEAEVTAFLGRERYQRDPVASAGYRNGHQPITVRTTSGPVTLERPKLRGTDQRFASQLLGAHVTRTNALEALVIAGFVRGLSTRDVEATLAEALGPQAALSRSTVSRICEQISGEFTAWSSRWLDDVELDYLYLDGTHFRYHPGARAEPVLVAYGITTTGAPVFLGLAPAGSEGHDPWVDFLGDLTNRGLRPPVLMVSDGAPGLLSAVEQVFPRSLRQRCTIHRARNVLAKVPTSAQAEVKAAYWQIFDGIDVPPGQAAVDEARRRAAAFVARYERTYPSAVACLTSTLDELTVHLRFPAEHWQRIRHTNLLERTFGETRRRTKVIGRLPGERSCLRLVWAVLDRASRGWRGLTYTPAATRLLQDLRRQLFTPPTDHANPEPVTTAA
jgi:transposase-like protein